MKAPQTEAGGGGSAVTTAAVPCPSLPSPHPCSLLPAVRQFGVEEGGAGSLRSQIPDSQTQASGLSPEGPQRLPSQGPWPDPSPRTVLSWPGTP